MEHSELPVSSVDNILILGHSVKSNASVDSIGHIAEQSFAHLLGVAHCDVQSLAGHHCLDSVSSQLIQLHCQKLSSPGSEEKNQFHCYDLIIFTCS